MAKTLSEKLLNEILETFVAAERNPSSPLFESLAKASGLAVDSVKRLHREIYQEVNETDDDPLVPPAGFMG